MKLLPPFLVLFQLSTTLSTFLPPAPYTSFLTLPRAGSTEPSSGLAKTSSSTAKKTKKAKKHNKTASTAMALTPPPDSLETAILASSNTANSVKVTSLPPTSPSHIIALSPDTLTALSLFDGDAVSIKGRRGATTVATVTTSTTLPPPATPSSKTSPLATLPSAALPNTVLANCNVKPNDVITLTPISPKFARNVLILPYADSLPSDMTTDIFTDYLQPYFSNKYIPVSVGDVHKIDGPDGVVEFQVAELEAVEEGDGGVAIVVDETTFDEGEPLDRPTDDLASAGYSEIGGASNHLAAIRELVELPLKHPELWRSLGINPPRGVLLTGPSGCGKTEMARAVAAETDCYFFVINGPEVISKRAGESETNLRRAFEDAEANAEAYNGAIIFIDEIDSIAPKRDKAGGEVEKRIVSQLLTLMDGLKPTSRVVVIGASNRPSVIEGALRRPGRFDRELDMGVPDEHGRAEILQIKSRDMKLAEDVDIAAIARDSHGYVGADLQQLCMEAALACIREKMPHIDFDEESVDKEILDSILINSTHFGHAMGVVHPSSLRENAVEIPDVKWEDVGGLEDVKRELHETVQYPVEHAEKYMKFGMHPSKGVLFYGPPGCGKTLLAKAIANECGANFISVKGPELLTQWFGESEANVRELFDKARAASPCILMFDEIDSIAKTRGSGQGGASEAGDRVINQILTEIDGVGARKNVFVIGATNRPDVLDPAVIRPGRLDQLIYIPLPDLKSRVAIFKAALRKAPVDPAVDFDVLARSTNGFSGADITEICQRASKMAIREQIIKEESRLRKVERGELGETEGKSDPKDMIITKKHFNFAMSKARKSVTEQDLVLFQQFSDKQKAGRGEAVSTFKFEDKGGKGAASGEGEKKEDEVADDELY